MLVRLPAMFAAGLNWFVDEATCSAYTYMYNRFGYGCGRGCGHTHRYGMAVWEACTWGSGQGRAWGGTIFQRTLQLHEGLALVGGKIPIQSLHEIWSALPREEGWNSWRVIKFFLPSASVALCSQGAHSHPSAPHLCFFGNTGTHRGRALCLHTSKVCGCAGCTLHGYGTRIFLFNEFLWKVATAIVQLGSRWRHVPKTTVARGGQTSRSRNSLQCSTMWFRNYR